MSDNDGVLMCANPNCRRRKADHRWDPVTCPYPAAGPVRGNDGLQARYEVKKINDPDGKHDECRYFVLDPTHDPIARTALAVYAEHARAAGLTELANDLHALLYATRSDESGRV